MLFYGIFVPVNLFCYKQLAVVGRCVVAKGCSELHIFLIKTYCNMNFKKFFGSALVAVMAFAATTSQAQSLSPSTTWHWDKGTIVVDTPERPEGQQHVLNLAVAPIKTVRVAFVGLGMRGPGAVERFCYIPGVEIVALCDYEEARAERCQQYLRNAGLMPADI